MAVEQVKCDCYLGWTTPQRKIVCPKCNGTGLIAVEVADEPIDQPTPNATNPNLKVNEGEQNNEGDRVDNSDDIKASEANLETTQDTPMSFLKGD